MFGERCCRIGLATTSPWIFSGHRRTSIGEVSLSYGATSPASQIIEKEKSARSSWVHR